MIAQLQAILIFLAISASCFAEVARDYALSPEVSNLAEEGFGLYKAGKLDGGFNGGHYTNTDPKTPGKDFWSNGKYAIVDRDKNGHFETIFAIHDGKLNYVGSIGPKGTFVDVSPLYSQFAGKSINSFTSKMR